LPSLSHFRSQQLRRTPMSLVRVIDGDTIVINGEHVRLQGVDAPETDQTCNAYGREWPCGRTAAEWLKEHLHGRQIECVGLYPNSSRGGPVRNGTHLDLHAAGRPLAHLRPSWRPDGVTPPVTSRCPGRSLPA
jgi:hypothetical protein